MLIIGINILTDSSCNSDDVTVEINHSPDWPYIPTHPRRIFIICGSESGRTNVILNLIKHQRPDIDKIYLYKKDPFESKYQLLTMED